VDNHGVLYVVTYTRNNKRFEILRFGVKRAIVRLRLCWWQQAGVKERSTRTLGRLWTRIPWSSRCFPWGGVSGWHRALRLKRERKNFRCFKRCCAPQIFVEGHRTTLCRRKYNIARSWGTRPTHRTRLLVHVLRLVHRVPFARSRIAHCGSTGFGTLQYLLP
jgi:hypothetical protein